MDIVNVIVTDRIENCGNILSIESFVVHEEQLKNEVVKAAEERYIELCVSYGIDEVDAEESIEDGFCDVGYNLISIVWSYSNNN